jgi:hypothetical protein
MVERESDPNLPLNSVVVMDNAPYHGRQEDKPPPKTAVKKYMIDWLRRRGVAYQQERQICLQQLKSYSQKTKFSRWITCFMLTDILL